VSKTKPAKLIEEAYELGQCVFGENYLQEALVKINTLRELKIEWHYLGRLQSNKTREIAEHFSWVHTLASKKQAERLDRQRPVGMGQLQVCIQVNLSGEKTKGGVTQDAIFTLADQVSRLKNLRLRGLMTMPDPESSIEDQRKVFATLNHCKQMLNDAGFGLDTLSMGMSADLELAIAEGATIVRIGTDVFGPRL
jgi:pyridoxal phosphate enzyme (YggS family)